MTTNKLDNHPHYCCHHHHQHHNCFNSESLMVSQNYGENQHTIILLVTIMDYPAGALLLPSLSSCLRKKRHCMDITAQSPGHYALIQQSCIIRLCWIPKVYLIRIWMTMSILVMLDSGKRCVGMYRLKHSTLKLMIQVRFQMRAQCDVTVQLPGVLDPYLNMLPVRKITWDQVKTFTHPGK